MYVNVSVDVYPQLTPTPILIQLIANSHLENYYDMLVEDGNKEEDDDTVVTSNITNTVKNESVGL